MFKLRLISALILIPMVVLGILFLPTTYVAIASGIVFALAAAEWLKMIGVNSIVNRMLLLTLLIIVTYSFLIAGLSLQVIYFFALLWWLIGLIGICYFPRGSAIWRQILLQPLAGLLMFVPAWLAFNQMHSMQDEAISGPIWVLLGCCLIWGADIGAYFAGKLWGKDKLVENVSPGKTWVGLYGAIVTSCLIMLGFYWLMAPKFSALYAIWLALITVLFAVIGDLVESLFKRVYGYKDSGNVIPGHGGVFDRVDSMLAAFPVYGLALQLLLGLRIVAV